jgi:GNAT superfamily N-acetyltransferase
VASGQTLVAVCDDAVGHDAVGHDAVGHDAVDGTGVVGYLVMDHAFFERGFVVMLCVHPEHRRRGIGQALMRHAEVACRTQRIFTSTNRSNLPMQRLLEGLGYRCSGMVEDLDPGDPEVFYSRGLSEARDQRLAAEAAKLDAAEEEALAEEGLASVDAWLDDEA